ncbi:MAG: TetR family transcriptional regulator [Gammaproteobacteria bacterium]|nr:TetR family transcriptional regulator [Gammaproteobacteria bacterium]
MINMPPAAADAPSPRKEFILNAAIPVFGRFGFKKTSVDELAEAANISKQGLYLHFSGKEEIFLAAMRKYLDDGLALVQHELARMDTPLFDRLMGAMDVWFGRHFETFTPKSFGVIDGSSRTSGNRAEDYQSAFQAKLRKALADSSEFRKAKNICKPKEISEVLFMCGLTWKEGHTSRADFMKKMAVCIRACCQIEV